MLEQNYVDGFSVIQDVNKICENCVVEKQYRDSFSKGLARRASKLA